MIVINGKEYSTIIWDWRSTLYDPFRNILYEWVISFFNKKKCENILVSFTVDKAKRMDLIVNTGMDKYFTHILLTSTQKKELFEKIFDELGYTPENCIVIGDNENDEIRIAKEMGIDSINIKDLDVAKL